VKRTNAWLLIGLLGAACLHATAAHAQQACFGPNSTPTAPRNAANGSYTSDYATCNTNGYTARAWLTSFQLLAGWKRIEGRRSNACYGLPGVVGYLAVSGHTLNFANGADGVGFSFQLSPRGCTTGTIGYTLTNPDVWFYDRGCSVHYGSCPDSVGAGYIEFAN
jgi:hypothetical protein